MPEAGRMPNFIVIGAMKAGTTSLYHYLREHPQVFMPKIKELDFFAVEESWARGPEWYARQFAGADGAAAVGEASTAYSKHPHYPKVPDRIARAIPDCRLIYVVRDPVDRIASHYRHRVAVGAERLPLERAVGENPIYLDYSRYARQIDRYLECFDREQLFVVDSERLRSDRRATVQSIYRFLGVGDGFLPASLTREFYRTADRRAFPALAWSVRRTVRRYFPAAKRAKEFVDSAGRALRHRPDAGRSSSDQDEDRASVMPDEVRSLIADELREDSLRLRGFLGPAFDGWGL